MTSPAILVLAGFAFALAAVVHILLTRPVTGSTVLAAILSFGFAGFTAVTIAREGLVQFWTNHVANLTGVQVWWDLLMAVTIALFFIAPRARKAGMDVPAWSVLVVATASIGLLAMAARLFWLERTAGEASAVSPRAAI